MGPHQCFPTSLAKHPKAGPHPETPISLTEGGAWASALFKALWVSLKCSQSCEPLGHILPPQANVCKSLRRRNKTRSSLPNTKPMLFPLLPPVMGLSGFLSL